MKHLLILPFLYFSVLFASEIPEKAIVVVIPSYNNIEWYGRNLSSIMNQEYGNFRILYINDCSTDGTDAAVEHFAKEHPRGPFRVITFDEGSSESILEITSKFKAEINQEKAFFTLVNNLKRCDTLANQYRAFHSCDDHEIIITVDGDDWLADNEVLKKINQTYSSGEVWMTHGTLVEYPNGDINWSLPIPQELVATNMVRQCRFPSHLRTFYAWIFKKIALEDLLYEGKFFAMTGDMAIMLPILEMAGERHLFIHEPIYMYNMTNPISHGKVNAELQRSLDRYIRSMPPYQRLEKGQQ